MYYLKITSLGYGQGVMEFRDDNPRYNKFIYVVVLNARRIE